MRGDNNLFFGKNLRFRYKPRCRYTIDSKHWFDDFELLLHNDNIHNELDDVQIDDTIDFVDVFNDAFDMSELQTSINNLKINTSSGTYGIIQK